MKKMEKCNACNGKGNVNNHIESCPFCLGMGERPDSNPDLIDEKEFNEFLKNL